MAIPTDIHGNTYAHSVPAHLSALRAANEASPSAYAAVSSALHCLFVSTVVDAYDATSKARSRVHEAHKASQEARRDAGVTGGDIYIDQERPSCAELARFVSKHIVLVSPEEARARYEGHRVEASAPRKRRAATLEDDDDSATGDGGARVQ